MVSPDVEFMAEMAALEPAYLRSEDPLVQSGFSGGAERWIEERSPLLEAIDRDGEFLDVGCANGLLASDVTRWAQERGYVIEPFGVDVGQRLIALAKQRLPDYADNFIVADAWTWRPNRRWTYVYSLLDLGPESLRCEWLRRLYDWVAPGGRLIIGSYGSQSRGTHPEPVPEVLQSCGREVSGSAAGGEGPITRYGWATKT